ncbi:MAG: MFS transporter, partial [Candidatus Lokiarchaeota archaeon]|nr:MFS transporter [Candidatus Lokiarchaeota archaeon]
IAQALLEPFFARLAEVHGYRRVILGSLAIFFAGTILCGFATTFWTMLAFRAVQGTGAFYSAMLLYVNHSRPAEERPRAFATFSITITTGWIAGIVLGGWLDTFLEIHAIFFVMAAMAGATIVLSIAFLPRGQEEARIIAAAREIGAETGSPGQEGATDDLRGLATGGWHRKRDFILLNAINFARNAVFQAVLSFLLFYISIFLASWGLPDGMKGIVILPMVVTYIAFILLGGARAVLDRYGKAHIIAISLVVLVPFLLSYGFFFQAMVTLPYEDNACVIWFLFLLFTTGCAAGFGLPQAPVTTLSMEYLPARRAGYLAGLFNMVMFLAGAIGPVVFSMLVDVEQIDLLTPPFLSFAGTGLLIAIVAILSMRLREAGRKRQDG